MSGRRGNNTYLATNNNYLQVLNSLEKSTTIHLLNEPQPTNCPTNANTGTDSRHATDARQATDTRQAINPRRTTDSRQATDTRQATNSKQATDSTQANDDTHATNHNTSQTQDSGSQSSINSTISEDNTTAAENLATNPFIGDEIKENEKEEDRFRIYFANINGFTLSENGGEYAEFLLEMQKLQADTWGVAETNIDSTKSAVKNIIHNTTRKHFEFSKTTFGSSNIPARKRYYKPGGTLMGSQGSITARIMDQGSDSLGRWSFQLMSCKNNKKLLVVAAYQVCKQTITYTDNDGNTTVRSYTASAQQSSMLLVQGRRESPREAFIMDLKEFILRYQDQQCEILLLGDFNEPMSDSGEGMSALGSQCNLVDVMQQQIGYSDFGTHVMGQERIDFILASEGVANAVRQACYEPFKFRGSGDHRGMILDLDTLALFGNKTQSLAPLPCREFTAKDPVAVRQYVTAKHRYLSEHNFGTRLERAKTLWTPQVQEQLDGDFQRAGIFGAKQCTRKPRNIAFSSELATLRRRKNVLLKTISSIRLKRSFEEAIARYREQDEDFEIPTTLAECQTLCKQIQQQIRQSTKDAVFHRQNEQLIQLKDAEAKGNKKKAKLIKNLMAAERTKSMYRKIRQCRGAEKAGITRLDVPADPDDVNYKSCVDWISIDTPEEIESRLLQRNQTHFGQADGLFPTRPPFSEWVDWGASTHVADLILEGQWNTNELDSVTLDVIHHLQARTNLDEIKDTITIEEWKEKIRSWPEKTSTSPSGFHLSHSKALVTPIAIEDDKETTIQLEHQQQQLIEWQVSGNAQSSYQPSLQPFTMETYRQRDDIEGTKQSSDSPSKSYTPV